MSALDDHIKNASHKRWGTVALLSIFSLVSVSMLVLIVLSLIVPPALEKMVDAYTEPEPMLLPAIVFSESEKAEVEARLEDFELGL